jgi:hypothetical protein
VLRKRWNYEERRKGFFTSVSPSQHYVEFRIFRRDLEPNESLGTPMNVEPGESILTIVAVVHNSQ